MTYPCPECGCKKGQAHEAWCKRAQVRRRPGFGRLPVKEQHRYQPGLCTPRVYKTYKNTEYLRCSVCGRNMGKRAKGK